jgi:carboxyl-terminal processing protease
MVVEQSIPDTARRRGNGKLVRILLGLAAVMFVAIVAVAAFAVGRESNGGTSEAAPVAATTNGEFDYGLLNEIRELLDRYYVRPENLDDQSLFEAAINGMLDILGDSGTYYVTPDVHQRSTLITGSFEGIGATISQDGDRIVIVAPINGTPAERAGLVSGDVILAVDGESMIGWSTDEAVLRIRGEKGTQVVLTIEHADGSVEDVTIIRDTVLIDSVYREPPGGILRDASGNEVTNLGYIWIQSFTGRTTDELSVAINELMDAGIEGLILDVRNNSGGLVNTTVGSLDLLMDEGIMFIERDAAGNETSHVATPGQLVGDIPVVVLQNRFSASAAEIVAAALAENELATTIGETTFGKGTVNLSRNLSDGGALYITIREWLTPSRTLINNVGVRPDIEVIPTDEQIDAREDPQLQRAIEVLQGQIQP